MYYYVILALSKYHHPEFFGVASFDHKISDDVRVLTNNETHVYIETTKQRYEDIQKTMAATLS